MTSSDERAPAMTSWIPLRYSSETSLSRTVSRPAGGTGSRVDVIRGSLHDGLELDVDRAVRQSPGLARDELLGLLGDDEVDERTCQLPTHRDDQRQIP